MLPKETTGSYYSMPLQPNKPEKPAQGIITVELPAHPRTFTPTATVNQLSSRQVDQQAVSNLRKNLKTKSMFIMCPYCKKPGMSHVENKCNYANLSLCIFTSPFFWIVYQAFRSKDFNCYNARHICSHCKALLGEYTAC